MHTPFLRTLTVAALAVVSLSTVARAQAPRYIGNGQALDVKANVLNLVGVEIASSVAGPQPTLGGNFNVGLEARAGNVSTLGLNAPNLVSGVNNFLSVNASALAATSDGGAGQVLSTATIGTVGGNDTAPKVNLGLSVPGNVLAGQSAVNLSSFLSATAIRTETFASLGVRTSQTIIEGLAIRDGSGNYVSVANSLLGLGTTGTTLLDGTSSFSFLDSDPTVGLSVAGAVGNNNVLATVLLHEKVNNADGSRTTNGIHVTLASGALRGDLAGADVVLASSTAGVAPEPSSFGLLTLAIGVGTLFLARRRGIMHSKA